MKGKLKTWAGPLLGAILFFTALGVLHHELAVHHLKDILAQMRSLPPGRVAAAVLLAACGYGVLTLYDLLALRYLDRSLARGKVTMAAFVGAAFSNNIGLSMIAGASVRYRLYASWGLSAVEITKIVFFCTLTLWLGFLTVGGLCFLSGYPTLPSAIPLPSGATRAIGALLSLAALAYPVAGKLWQRPVRIFNWEIEMPSWRTGALQLLVGAADWILAGSTLIVLLPSTAAITLPKLLGIFMLAQLAGLGSQVPGGLGVFETVFLLLIGKRIPTEVVMGALFVYRAIYYLAPLALSAVLLGVHEVLSHRASVRSMVDRYGRWSGSLVPPVLAFTTFVGGAILLFSGATPALDHRLAWLKQIIPLSLLEMSHFLGSMIGTALLLLARGLQRRLDGAYWTTLMLLAVGSAASLLKGLDYEEALVLALLFAALLPSHRFFYRRTSLLNQRFSPGWLAAIGIVMVSTLWLSLFSYKHLAYRDSLWWQFAFSGHAPRSLRAAAGAVGVLLFYAMARLMRPPVYRPAASTPAETAAAEQIVKRSPRSDANLALLDDKSFLFNAQRSAFIMYAVEGRSWVSMGDPVGPEDQWTELLWHFRERSDGFGGWSVFYQVTPDHLPFYLDLGLSLTKLGETARVPLAAFSMEGRARKELRYTHRKLQKAGLAVEILPPAEGHALLDRLKPISDRWLAEKNTPEKGFSLGRFDPRYLRHFDMAVVQRNGAAVAFANLWQGAEHAELSVDLMRYDPAAAPPGVMDYLFIELMHWGRDQGYRWFDLGMAPLAGIEDRALAPLWNRMAAFLARHGEPFYNFQGLRRYKDKFDPVWEPRYLASPGGLVLPAVLGDLVQLISGGIKGAVLK